MPPPEPTADAVPDSGPRTSAGSTASIIVAVLHATLVVIGLVAGLLGSMILAMPAAFAVMMFDDPAASSVFWTNLLAYGVMTAPVVVGGAAILGALPLVLSILGVIRRSVGLGLLGLALTTAIFCAPLLNLIAVIAGAVGLDVYCHGHFGCPG